MLCSRVSSLSCIGVQHTARAQSCLLRTGPSAFIEQGRRTTAANARPLSSTRADDAIARLGTDDPRMSKLVLHGTTVYMSGQTAAEAGDDATLQTQAVLDKVEQLLTEAGSDKSKLLSASIWLKDINRDFKAMNAVWCAWIDPDNKPVRATVQAEMARPSILVEVQVIAAR